MTKPALCFVAVIGVCTCIYLAVCIPEYTCKGMCHACVCVFLPSFLPLWLQHAEVPEPGIKPAAHQWPKPQQWQCCIFNLLSHQGTPMRVYLEVSWSFLQTYPASSEKILVNLMSICALQTHPFHCISRMLIFNLMDWVIFYGPSILVSRVVLSLLSCRMYVLSFYAQHCPRTTNHSRGRYLPYLCLALYLMSMSNSTRMMCSSFWMVPSRSQCVSTQPALKLHCTNPFPSCPAGPMASLTQLCQSTSPSPQSELFPFFSRACLSLSHVWMFPSWL